MEQMRVVCFSFLFLQLLFVPSASQPDLGHFNVDDETISVSGLSSGGFFAVQFHVAFSSIIQGAGIIAGGPFWCAQANVQVALSACMRNPELLSTAELVQITHNTALTGTIDNPANMRGHPVYLFSGTLDTVVVQGVMKKLEEYYSHFTDNVTTEFTIPAEHSIVTDSYGNNCSVLKSPFINNCNYPTAYHILQHIYGDIKPVRINSASGNVTNLCSFNQREFFVLPGDVSMDSEGYVYVPVKCQQGQKCRLHIAFHGCQQGRFYICDEFARNAGYNGLAEENNLIILYPQIIPQNITPINPNGCWDWWGYTGVDYASKLGLQMAGVKRMLDRIVYG